MKTQQKTNPKQQEQRSRRSPSRCSLATRQSYTPTPSIHLDEGTGDTTHLRQDKKTLIKAEDNDSRNKTSRRRRDPRLRMKMISIAKHNKCNQRITTTKTTDLSWGTVNTKQWRHLKPRSARIHFLPFNKSKHKTTTFKRGVTVQHSPILLYDRTPNQQSQKR